MQGGNHYTGQAFLQTIARSRYLRRYQQTVQIIQSRRTLHCRAEEILTGNMKSKEGHMKALSFSRSKHNKKDGFFDRGLTKGMTLTSKSFLSGSSWTSNVILFRIAISEICRKEMVYGLSLRSSSHSSCIPLYIARRL